ncbi:MAG: YybH family protein [Phycisphaerales bacterium JB043]
MARVVLGLLAALVLAGCGTNGVSYRQRILAANEALETRFRDGDMLGVASVYAEDAVMHGPGGGRVEGREGVEAYWMGIAEPIDWDLRVDDLRICADRAWQLGRSTLRYVGDDGRERTSVVDFHLIWRKQRDGSWQIGEDTWWSPDADYREAIRRVLREDDRLASIRNGAVEERPIHEVIREYADALWTMNFEGCPGDFREAYYRHTMAWDAMVGVLAPYGEMRGQMHDVMDELTAEDAPSRERVQTGLDAVWSTWGDVEDSVVRHGAHEQENKQ